MKQRVTKNEFTKALNTNVDKNKIPPNQYLEAHNVELTGEGNFFALSNTKLTTLIKEVTNDSEYVVLRQCPNRYKIGDNFVNGLTIFAYKPSTLFKIWCYDVDSDQLYELYQEVITSDYTADNRVLDLKIYPENGIDIVYFTDFYNEIRKLRCEIPLPYSANFMSDFDLSVQRRGGTGSISFDTMVTGSLLSGTYQFAYRCVNPNTKALTKWSSLTNPIHVYTASNSGTNVPYAGIGLPTLFGIRIDINPTQDELANFDYFQLAVVENIYPSGPESVIDGNNTTFVASLLQIEQMSGRFNYDFKSNAKIGTIPISDLTVDLAQIDTVKTLNVHQNRLFAGNIKYKNLEFDNGTPAITSGSIKRRTSGAKDSYADQQFSSKYVGYFRDEVYRFGIVYYDKYGNKSPVQTLNLSNVTDNRILSGLIDMKFPSRSFHPNYSLFDPATFNMQGLGLQLNGIVNHPSWAVKFEIVRSKRIKNIQFQTPVIPYVGVSGTGVLGEYPSKPVVPPGTETTDADAEPMTASEVIVPKNLFWPELRGISRISYSSVVNGIQRVTGECYLDRLFTYNYAGIFPPSNMYSSVAFSPTGGEKMTFVDYATLKLNFRNDSPIKTLPVVPGDDVNTNVSGTFHALKYDQYYFDPLTTGKNISVQYKNIPLTEYEFFDNGSTGSSIAGKSVLRYSDLQTKNYDFGYQPTTQRTSVVKLNTEISDVNNFSKVFISGTLNSPGTGAYVFGSSGAMFESVPATSNKYITAYSNYTQGDVVGAIAIANIELGLGDDRYGTSDTLHEFISTGATHVFTNSQIQDIQAGNSVPISIEVWGGDCFVGPQVFKISDSTYSVVNQTKWNSPSTELSVSDMLSKWGTIYQISNGQHYLSMPVALENVGQFVQVVLESEYNGQIREPDVLTDVNNGEGVPIFRVSDKASIRTPLTYSYNINLSKQNDEKVYFPKPQFTFEQNDFSARVIYSDLKIYNSSEQGFDVFRVLNFNDLEESRGHITKMAVETDNLYAIQSKGITYLPIGQTQLQQTDGGMIAAGIAGVIGRPIVINTERGSQHLRGISETGDVIFIPDVANKAVYLVAGQQFNIISEIDNDSLFSSIFNDQIPEKNLIGIYDSVRRQYWLANNQDSFCYIFNEKMKAWIGNKEFQTALFDGCYLDQTLYLTGIDASDSVCIYSMYTGNYTELFGTNVVPRVVVSINPDDDLSKVFDNMMFAATDRLEEVELVVERESALGNQTITTSNLDIDPVEGNYRIKVLLDQDNSRARGLRMIGTIKWGNLPSTLSSVWTKYRLNNKIPF